MAKTVSGYAVVLQGSHTLSNAHPSEQTKTLDIKLGSEVRVDEPFRSVIMFRGFAAAPKELVATVSVNGTEVLQIVKTGGDSIMGSWHAVVGPGLLRVGSGPKDVNKITFGLAGNPFDTFRVSDVVLMCHHDA